MGPVAAVVVLAVRLVQGGGVAAPHGVGSLDAVSLNVVLKNTVLAYIGSCAPTTPSTTSK